RATWATRSATRYWATPRAARLSTRSTSRPVRFTAATPGSSPSRSPTTARWTAGDPELRCPDGGSGRRDHVAHVVTGDAADDLEVKVLGIVGMAQPQAIGQRDQRLSDALAARWRHEVGEDRRQQRQQAGVEAVLDAGEAWILRDLDIEAQPGAD